MDTIYINGKIHTMDNGIVEAVRICGGKILEVGNTGDLIQRTDEKTIIYDLKNRTVIPGFNDSHCHMLLSGIEMESLDLKGCRSEEEIVTRGRMFISEHKIAPGSWIIGRGFNQNLFEEQKLFEKGLVDEISVEHPILLDRVCGHVGVLNSLGLKVLGLSEEFQIEGGEVGKNDSGLNGLFWETALDHIKDLIPGPDENKMRELVLSTSRFLNELGITSVQSNDTNSGNYSVLKKIALQLAKEENLSVRIYEEVQVKSLSDLEELISQDLESEQPEFFRFGNVKLFTDGSLGAHSALLLKEYADLPGEKGIRVYEDRTLKELIKRAAKKNLQVACHAIGDGAVAQCIESMKESMVGENGMHLRHRIVHCQLAGDDLLTQMSENGICSDIQPPFVATDYQAAEKSFGDRVKCSYRWKTMLDIGIHLGGGSDSPVETFDPIWGIHCAVNRTDQKDLPKGGWMPEEKLSVYEAVSLYTSHAAYLSFEEKEKGQIRPGMLGDFIVLSQDIFSIPKENIKNTKVLGTIIGGRICFAEDADIFEKIDI